MGWGSKPGPQGGSRGHFHVVIRDQDPGVSSEYLLVGPGHDARVKEGTTSILGVQRPGPHEEIRYHPLVGMRSRTLQFSLRSHLPPNPSGGHQGSLEPHSVPGGRYLVTIGSRRVEGGGAQYAIPGVPAGLKPCPGLGLGQGCWSGGPGPALCLEPPYLLGGAE